MKKSYVLGGFLLLTSLVVGLSGCAVSEQPDQGILEHSIACFPEQQDARSSALTQHGLRVERLGDHIEIIFSASQVFSDMKTATLNDGFQHETAVTVAKFLSCFRKTNVSITAYTNLMPTSAENFSLSQQQAKSIMNALWDSGLNTRIMGAIGGGSTVVSDPAGLNRVVIATKLRRYNS